MKILVIATIKKWNIENAKKFARRNKKDCRVFVLDKKSDLQISKIKKIDPDYIFFPHWSWKIPSRIYEKYECVAFHMTDLPYGRGGSPLQNLIVQGKRTTKISALKVIKEFDAGPVYLKRTLGLDGSASDIYQKASRIIFQDMIPSLLARRQKPVFQKGKVVYFRRRKPEESSMEGIRSVKSIYDHIRMLDAEGYPNAFLETENLRFAFTCAKSEKNYIIAKVKIGKRK